MEGFVPNVLLPFLAWLGVGFLVYKAFDIIDTNFPGLHDRVRRMFDPKRPVSSQEWVEAFNAMFDSVFGKKHLRWRCIWRSAVLSIFTVGALVITIGWQVWGLRSLDDVYFLLVFAVVLNLVPDYVSLLETRVILKWASKNRSIKKLAAWLTMDVLLTGAVFLAWTLFVESTLLNFGFFKGPTSLGSVLQFFQDPALRIFFLSTYATSVWLWLFVGGILAIRMWNTFNAWRGNIRDIGELKQPIRLLGSVAGAAVFVLGTGGYFISSWFA